MPLAGRSALDAVFRPRTVALIGGSAKPGSVGHALLENLRPFPGQLFVVNPNHDFLLDRRAFPSLADVPAKVDLAIIAVAAPKVVPAVRECVAAGVTTAVIIASGFRESGPAGAELEREVLREARLGSLRLIGPNCLGVSSPPAGLDATFASTLPRPGHLAFLSQSGALCSAVLDWSRRENIGFSAFVSVGSMLDVSWADLLSYLGDDPNTHSILLYLESVGDARSFLAAARRAARKKPVVVLKAGRTAEAAHAAASHTGAMTGRDDAFDAALNRVGVLRVDTTAELFALAEALATQPIPAGSRLTIVTNAGGPGALAADGVVLGGGQLAVPGARTLAQLNDLLPSHWSHGNPVDVLGDAGPDRFNAAIQAALQDPESDGVLAILTPQAMTDPAAAARQLAANVRPKHKPVLACWMGAEAVAEGRKLLHEACIPVFEYPETAARAFCQLARIGELQRSLNQPPHRAGAAPSAGHRAAVSTQIEQAQSESRTILSEYESKQLLAHYGIPCVQTRLAETVDAAVAAAAHIGYPVALKLHSHTLTHKADVGGVQLNLGNEPEVREAWERIYQSVLAKAGREHFLGVTVQPMVTGGGCELILGSSSDPQFGPIILFGAGGSRVDIFHDHSLGLPPLDAALARQMAARTRIFPLLRGAHGSAPADLAQLDQLIVHFSDLVAARKEIAEIDLNPVVWTSDGFVALDARVILHPRGSAAASQPGAALLPDREPREGAPEHRTHSRRLTATLHPASSHE